MTGEDGGEGLGRHHRTDHKGKVVAGWMEIRLEGRDRRKRVLI